MTMVSKRFFSALLATVMVFCIVPVTNSNASAPVTPDFAAGDMIEYGSYPQTKVTDASLIAHLNSCPLSADNTVTYGGTKYKKVRFAQYTPYLIGFPANVDYSWQDDNGYLINTTYWFKYEPIQWRVLLNSDGALVLMAEKIVDSINFKQTDTSVTWETSSLRTWLNNTFYNAAFSPTEKSRIILSDVSTADNPWTGANGGNDTKDKLAVFEFDDMINADFGFNTSYEANDTARMAQGTDYAKSSGLYVNPSEPNSGNSYWWLRSPGNPAGNVGFVGTNGGGIGANSCNPKNTDRGVRPVFVLSKSPQTYVRGDIIQYGSYPQSKVTVSALITALNACNLSADNTATYGGEKYKKVNFSQYSHVNGGFTANTNLTFQDDNGYLINTVYWFKIEPVIWEVLSNNNGELLVMAVKILDSKAYNNVSAAITWETCSVRIWLNNEFYNSAFLSSEQAMIKISSVVNDDNTLTGTDGGNTTSDKLFLLSHSQSVNAACGFGSNSTLDTLRQVQGTDYSKCIGLYIKSANPYMGNSNWWLRSPGNAATNAGLCNTNGTVNANGEIVETACLGVRPAMKLNLNSDTFTSAENSNCIINYDYKCIYGLDAGMTSLDGCFDVAAGYALTGIPTGNGLGTGTVVNITLAGATVESYKIIIFGDVNGDANVDSMDAGLAVDVENYIVGWDPDSDEYLYLAGDINGDGSVDSIDAGIMVDCENYLLIINQETGIAD